MLAGECERASDCKPPMPWSERGWAPTRAKLEGPGPTCRALTCRTGHSSFVTDGDSTTSALHAISAYLFLSPCRRATFLSCTYAGNVCSTAQDSYSYGGPQSSSCLPALAWNSNRGT